MSESLSLVLSTFLSNLVVAISVFLLWLQIKEMRKQIQSSTYQTIVQMFDNFSQIILQNPHLAPILFGTAQTPDQIQAEWATAMRFDWFESVVIQKHKYRAIPDDLYAHWMSILEYELSMPFIRNIWNQIGNFTIHCFNEKSHPVSIDSRIRYKNREREKWNDLRRRRPDSLPPRPRTPESQGRRRAFRSLRIKDYEK